MRSKYEYASERVLKYLNFLRISITASCALQTLSTCDVVLKEVQEAE